MCQDIIIHVGDKRKIIIEDSSPIETTADEIAFLLRQHRKFMDYIDTQHIEGGKNVSIG